jgi:phosphomevalonate kinase
LSEYDLINNSMELHKLHQGKNGSGLDIISSHADSNLIECNKHMLSEYKWNTLDWPKNLIIKGVHTSQQSSTSSMIEKYNIGKHNNSLNFKSLYSQMAKILEDFSQAWHQGRSSDILNLLKKQNTLIKQLDHDFDLGIYTQEHNKILDLAESLGLFYKPSGAGGGDLGILISDDAIKMKKLCNALSKINHYVIDLRK